MEMITNELPSFSSSPSDLCGRSLPSGAEQKFSVAHVGQMDNAILPDVTLFAPPKTSSASHKCPICDDAAWIKHFGCYSCNACASFFRRSVSKPKIYHCRSHGRCAISYKSKVRLCQYCRFQACLRNGMKVEGVTKLRREPGIEESVLRKLVRTRNAIFVSRAIAYRRVLEKHSKHFVCGPHQNAVPSITSLAVLAELTVIEEYLRTSGLMETLLQHPSASVERLMEAILYPWLAFELVTNTLRHNGLQQRHVYFINDTILVATQDGLLDYYSRDERMLEPQPVAAHGLEYAVELLALTEIYRRAGFDEVEENVLLQLMLVTHAMGLVGRKSLQSYVNTLFKELHTHYDENYHESAVRLGTLVLLLREFHTLCTIATEHAEMIRLGGTLIPHSRTRKHEPGNLNQDAMCSSLSIDDADASFDL